MLVTNSIMYKIIGTEMLEKMIRDRYQHWLVNPVAIRVHAHISPTQVTLLAGIFGILITPALIYQQTILAILFLLSSGYCDTLDGTLARYKNQSSAWGSVVDIMTDRLVEFSIILALWTVNPSERSLLCLLMLGSVLLCVTSFLVVGVFTPNNSEKSFNYSPGLIERAEAFIFFILMILCPTYFNSLSLLFSGLVLLTAIIRLYQFYKLDYNND